MTPYGAHHHKRKALIPYMRTITTKPNQDEKKTNGRGRWNREAKIRFMRTITTKQTSHRIRTKPNGRSRWNRESIVKNINEIKFAKFETKFRQHACNI